MEIKTNIQCVNCGEKNLKAVPVITGTELKDTVMDNFTGEDKEYAEHLTRTGSEIPDSQYLKIYYAGDRMVKGKYRTLKGEYRKITQYVCSKCHCNITGLLDRRIKRMYNVLLIGMPGTSKSTTVISMVKEICDKKIKSAEILTSPYSYERVYYEEKANRYPEVPVPTQAVKGLLKRQPVISILVQNTLLTFIDLPGENYGSNMFYTTENTIPVYLYDHTQKESSQMSFFSHMLNSLHGTGKKKYRKEVIAIVKSDMYSEEKKKKIQLEEYNSSNKYSELYMARRMNMINNSEIIKLPVYESLRQYTENVDVLCMAALGSPTEKICDRYCITGKYNPEGLEDLLHTLAE